LKLFVDTGPLIARYLKQDGKHTESIKQWDALSKKQGVQLLTTGYVLSETATLLARRAGNQFAAERIRNITASSWIEVRYAGARETTAALNILSKFADQDLSFTDAVSFAVMRQEGLRDAISFDSHFERAGFRIWKAGR
jgi:predicted nucleic acid-binding protein